MRPVVVVGTGGHAREVAQIVRAMHTCGTGGALHGFVTDDQQQHGQMLHDAPILGNPEWLHDHAEVAVIIAIGHNPTRQKLAQRLSFCHFASAISPHAIIDSRALIDVGAMIFPQTVISCDVRLGAHTIVNVGASISHDITLGDFCNINPGVRIAGNCRLQEGVSIGIGATMIQGRTVGAWTVVGAGAAVVRDLPAHVTAVGVPATIIKRHASA